MVKLKQQYESNGFYGIGIMNNVNELNIGTLWRSAFILGASFIFTVDKRYKPQNTDVTSTWAKIPLYHYKNIKELKNNLPFSAKLIGVEMCENAIPLEKYSHPDRGVYLLGNERVGLSAPVLNECHDLIKLSGNYSLNVAVAGSLIAYDRISKIQHSLPKPPVT